MKKYLYRIIFSVDDSKCRMCSMSNSTYYELRKYNIIKEDEDNYTVKNNLDKFIVNKKTMRYNSFLFFKTEIEAKHWLFCTLNRCKIMRNCEDVVSYEDLIYLKNKYCPNVRKEEIDFRK